MPTFRRGKKSRLAEPASSVLAPVIRQLGIEEGVRLAQMRSAWDILFKEPLSLHMRPMKFSDGELLLQVDSPIWIQQLTFLKQDIIGKLGGYGVKSLRFRLGKITQGGKEKMERRAQELSAEDQKFISDVVSDLDDEEIRAAAKRAMERSLKAQKRSR